MKTQRIHLLLVEDDDLDVMNVHRALAQAPEVASTWEAMRSYWSVAEFAPPPSFTEDSGKA